MQILEQLEQSGKLRKIHHFMVMKPLKPGKDNITSQYNDTEKSKTISTLLSQHQYIGTVYCLALVSSI